MARQIIDTTTNNGTYIGDPAKTAFEKTNANFGEIYGWVNGGALARLNGGNQFTGNQDILGGLGVTSNLTVGGLFNVTNASLARIQATTASINISMSAVTAANEGTFGTLTNHAIGVYLNSTRRGGWDTGGNFTATSLNPTSTSDVKDNLEGYGEDASEVLDRLVVITYNYRPEFFESEKRYIGLLQENIKSVVPDAATDSATTTGTDEEGNEVDNFIPGNIDITQILAISVRAHQQKNARIKHLESSLASVMARLDAAGI